MRFYIIDDDPAVRSMLLQIIEDEELGEVAGEAEDGAFVDSRVLAASQTDIVILDLLMPMRDGIETARDLLESFEGKIIMLSQVESKEMIGEAYSLGIEYYVTKPINRLEVVAVIRKVAERMRLQKSIRDIRRSLSVLDPGGAAAVSKNREPYSRQDIVSAGRYLLAELGITGELGCTDLLDMLDYLFQYERLHSFDRGFPPLKELFRHAAVSKLGPDADPVGIKKEMKASEQRVRRAVSQALSHLASLGLTDFANAKFENYAPKFFDFTEVRKRMVELENGPGTLESARINTKKFVQALYLEAKRWMGGR
jgi:two-component system response regulator YcbB